MKTHKDWKPFLWTHTNAAEARLKRLIQPHGWHNFNRTVENFQLQVCLTIDSFNRISTAVEINRFNRTSTEARKFWRGWWLDQLVIKMDNQKSNWNLVVITSSWNAGRFNHFPVDSWLMVESTGVSIILVESTMVVSAQTFPTKCWLGRLARQAPSTLPHPL